MRTQPSRRKVFVCLAFSFVLAALSSVVSAQTPAPASRIVQPIDESNRVVLTGNTYYLARASHDAGAAPASLPMQRMMLLLRRSPAQEASLEQLLADQQNAGSPNYHNWLTPQQFGAQFGPSPAEIQAIVSWLQSHGFTIEGVSNSGMVIELSGTAGQVQSAFGTSIHKYTMDGVEHWANASDPSIPAALAPVVVGFDTLHNFPRKPMHVVAGSFTRNPKTHEVKSVTPAKPDFSLPCGNGITCYGLGPYDFATIYNVLPLWNASPAIDGTGQTLAVIGESDVDVKDIESFQALFGLPVKDPVVILNGPDPGISEGDETESDLDLEWSGAIAKGATVKFVIAATTNTTLGVDLAAQYAVDQNIAPVISESYGICELGVGTAGNQFYNSLWQQAAAQGITVLIAAGDSGSAACDSQDNEPPAPSEFGLQVSGFASTPYDTAVGGTDFNDLGTTTTYWNSANAPTTQLSAKGYIPEVPWNDSCTSAALVFYGFSTSAITNCNNPQLLDSTVDTVGGGGGKSSCTANDGQDTSSCSGGYAKPSWQTGTGVPADSKRDVPDVALYAAAGFYTGSFYIICEADQTSGIYCTPENQFFLGIGGTSASTPSFAGIMALVNQKTGSRQGNANYVLYSLAAQAGANCASTGTPAATCVFYDVTTGTNAMPCDGTVPKPVNCSNAGTEGIGILPGYNSNAGYDLTTGLGSVNAANLVNKWSTFSAALKSSSTTLTLSPTTGIVHGAPVNVTVAVAAVAPATGTPTGTIALEAPTSIDPGVTGFNLTAGAVSATTDVLPGGTYAVTAHYPGDNTFGPSNSAPVTVTVTPETSSATISIITQASNGAPLPFSSGSYGSIVYPRADIAGASGQGFASGNVTFTDNGQPINGGLTLPLNSQANTQPTLPIYNFAAGSHSISASYAGDASFKASSSTSPGTFTISQATLGLVLSATGAQIGGAATASVVFNGTNCGNAPTGTVTFFNGSTQFGAPQPVQITNPQPTCTLEGTANVNSTALSLGTNTITAKYSGDTNYASTVSNSATIDVHAPSSTAFTASPTSIQQGQSVTLTANVSTSYSGGPALTGTVSFFLTAQSTGLGTATLSNGQAQITTTALPAGTDQIGATYSGDTNYNESSADFTVQVAPGPDFAIAFSPSVLTVASPGSSASTTVMVTGGNGFNTPINFATATCAGLPSESSCSFNPASVAPGGTATLTVSTTAPSLMAPSNRPEGGPVAWFTDSARRVMPITVLGICCLFVMLLVLAPGGNRRRSLRWIAPAMMLAALILNSACGGGGGGTGGGSTGPKNPGTPVVQNQTVTVTVTSGTITHSFTFTLNVN